MNKKLIVFESAMKVSQIDDLTIQESGFGLKPFCKPQSH
jgi:hypothetical protein